MSGAPASVSAAEDRITVVAADDSHAAALAVFFREAWGTEGTAAGVREARARAAVENPVDPGVHPPTFLVLKGERVIGYCTSLPNRLWDGRTERGAYWAKGLMVLPEFRNGPIGFMVLKALTRAFRIGTSVTVAPASKRLFGSLGYTDFGAMPNFLLPLDVGAIASRLDVALLGLGRLPTWAPGVLAMAQRTGLARLGGTLAGAMFGAAVAVRGRTRFAVELDATPSEDDLDALWQRCRAELGGAPVRDADYWTHRYARDHEGRRYRFAAVREQGTLVGLAVLREPSGDGDPRLRGVRVVSFSDALFMPSREDVAIGVLTAARRQARRMGAHALLCSASHRAFVGALRSQWYVPLAGTIHFLLRDTESGPGWPATLDAWWLTRGDGYSDDSF